VTARRRSDAAVHDSRVPGRQIVVTMLLLTVLTIGLGLLGDALHPDRALGAVPHYSQAYTRAAIRSEAKVADYGKTQTTALLKLAYRESRWHNWSVSHAKRPQNRCYGTFQLSWGMAHGRAWFNPYWSTMRAIRYIKHRYGTPVRALAHSYRYGWY
jgi:hypothetical protein